MEVKDRHTPNIIRASIPLNNTSINEYEGWAIILS
jgi:hypothetical protein